MLSGSIAPAPSPLQWAILESPVWRRVTYKSDPKAHMNERT